MYFHDQWISAGVFVLTVTLVVTVSVCVIAWLTDDVNEGDL